MASSCCVSRVLVRVELFIMRGEMESAMQSTQQCLPPPPLAGSHTHTHTRARPLFSSAVLHRRACEGIIPLLSCQRKLICPCVHSASPLTARPSSPSPRPHASPLPPSPLPPLPLPSPFPSSSSSPSSSSPSPLPPPLSRFLLLLCAVAF